MMLCSGLAHALGTEAIESTRTSHHCHAVETEMPRCLPSQVSMPTRTAVLRPSCNIRRGDWMSSSVSGLPRFLTPHGGSRTGFATVQKTAAALEAEIRHLALPLGALTVPVADGIEDFAPMTPRIAEKTRAIAQRLALLAAVEFAVAGQALDMRGSFRLGRGTGAAFQFLRARCPALDDDRPLGAEFQQLGEAILAGELKAALLEPAAP